MKSNNQNNKTGFRVSGYLIGTGIGFITAIVVWAISRNFAIALSASAPIGVTLGISYEEKFQNRKLLTDPKTRKLLLTLLSVGLLLFIAILLIVK